MLLVFFPFSVGLQPVPTFSSGGYHRTWRGLGRIWGGDGAVDVSVLALGLMSVQVVPFPWQSHFLARVGDKIICNK